MSSITPPIFRFAFRYYDSVLAQWNYYFVVGGVVDTDTSPRWLSQGPKEWAEEGATISRDYEYMGMVIANGTPMSWTHEEAQILRHIFLTQGIEGKCDLYIEMYDVVTGVGGSYSQWLPDNFSLDFSTFVSEYDWVNINAMEGGFAAKLKARADTQYEIEVQNNADVLYLCNDGIELQAKISFSAVSAAEFPANTIDMIPKLSWIGTEGTNVSTDIFTVDELVPQEDSIKNRTGSTIDYNIHVKGNYIIDPNGSYTSATGYVTIRVIEHDGAGSVSSTTDIWISPTALPTGGGTAYFVDFTYNNYSLPSGHQITISHYLAAGSLGSGSGPAFSNGAWATTMCEIEVDYYFVNRFEPTYHPVLRATKVFEELITKITDDPFNTIAVSSTLLDTDLNSEIYLSCGDAVRNLEGSVMKISFNDLFKFLRPYFNAEFNYEVSSNTAYINELTSVYKNSLHAYLPSLGKAKSCKILPFSSQLFNNLTIGGGMFTYDQQKNDEFEVTNGKDDLSLNYKFLSPITKVKKDADSVSPIRTDPHGIEQIRINYSGKTLADSNSDNDLVAFHADKDAAGTFDLNGVTTDYRNLIRTPIDLTPGASFFNIENVFSPGSIYNVIFWPIYAVYRCGTWFRSLLKFNDSDYLKQQTTAKNTANNLKPIISAGVGPVVLDGSQDIQISSLCANDQVKFLPVLLECIIKEPVNLFRLALADKYAYVQVEYLANTYKGWIHELSSNPVKRGEAKAILLLTIDNDITKLER